MNECAETHNFISEGSIKTMWVDCFHTKSKLKIEICKSIIVYSSVNMCYLFFVPQISMFNWVSFSPSAYMKMFYSTSNKSSRDLTTEYKYVWTEEDYWTICFSSLNENLMSPQDSQRKHWNVLIYTFT